MNSYLITGSTHDERLEKAKKIVTSYKPSTRAFGPSSCRRAQAEGLQVTSLENHPDILLVNPAPSVGISQVRQLQKFLSRKPHQAKIKTVILPEAEKLTLPAQNAFLKTLEEPPAHSIIILCSQSKENLLPTIISRCQIIQLATKIEKIDKSLIIYYSLLITKLLNSKVGERLKLIEPYEKTREEAIKFCQEMILVLREILINDKVNKKANLQLTTDNLQLIITSLQQTLNLLKANVNVKLCLDNFVLGLFSKRENPCSLRKDGNPNVTSGKTS